jgi:hypothetical protein
MRATVSVRDRLAPRNTVITAVGLAAVGMFAFVLASVMDTGTYDVWGGMLVAPVLLVVTLPILARQADREGDNRVLWILLVALLAKLAGAVARDFVAFEVYGSLEADASGYHFAGVRLAARFSEGNFFIGLPSLTDTNFIRFITGVVYTFIGSSRLGGFLFFSWLGFWGLFFAYRAFTLAIPDGRRRGYAILLFFLPSLVFWPSSIGKESWVTFTIGLSLLGAAHLFSQRVFRGLVLAGLGLWGTALVRPHIAGMLGLAIAVAYLFRRSSSGRVFTPSKIAGLAVTGGAALVLVVQANSFLSNAFKTETDLGSIEGLTSVLQETRNRTGIGGSAFDAPSILESPLRTPMGVFTVLYRPSLLDASSAQTALAAVEGTVLLLLTLVRLPWVVSALKSFPQRPYVAFAASYAALFIVAFSSIGNFGILTRQRVQLLPLFLVLLCVPPKRAKDEPEPTPA